MLNKSIFNLIKPMMNIVLGVFFNKEIFSGRHFKNSFVGYRWCIKSLWLGRILRIGRNYPWPANISVIIANADNLIFDVNDINNLQMNGLYIQNGRAEVRIGGGTYIA